uniref:Uncharacterized protein n=1 Tax=Aureoumbra lagunensis TaxID=44058 RepID=A0A7S3NJV4_9STRA|mmetsp:Transcript_12084/g.16352  ORF Transcript_12084/g.16352 Transcript_12084/m.16352 type:complete len:175 (-) Transcript_12084:230-754(-)
MVWMMKTTFFPSLLFALVLNGAEGLAVVTRSQVLRASLGATLTPLISNARNEGDLPDGAFQFDRFIKVQSEWNRFGSRLKDESQVIDAKEWEAVGLFLRKLYDEGEDMIFITQNLDKTKQNAAKEIATRFRSSVKGADKPVREQDRPVVIYAYNETSALMRSFLELLQDVPDEL